jgi:hypothetical protein
MKRMRVHKGRSVRSIFWTSVVVGGVGFICVLGVARALTTAGAAGTGLGPLTAQTAGATTHFFPTPGAARELGLIHNRHGNAGDICGAGKCTLPLLYKGGKGVQHNPSVYLILWGSNWNSTGLAAGRQLIKLYKSISGSNYQGILTQYFDSTGRVSKTLKLTTFTDTSVTAPESVNEVKVREEALSAITTNKWTKDGNSQFVVVPAPGSTYEAGFDKNFCGYHAYNTANELIYTFVAYIGDEPFRKGCAEYDKNKNVDNVTSTVAAHEYAESATDPNPGSVTWATSDTELFEISDVCLKEDDELAGGIWVQGQWDNFQNTCSLSDASPAFVYGVTEAASGLTTTTAELNGSVNPEGLETKYHFEYGTTTAYGTKTAETGAGAGKSNVSVKTAISGLTTKTTYHFRLVAVNSTGTINGRDKEFTTS